MTDGCCGAAPSDDSGARVQGAGALDFHLAAGPVVDGIGHVLGLERNPHTIGPSASSGQERRCRGGSAVSSPVWPAGRER